ncbi:hypothetical protein FKM82_026208 [Ascaphus truei]
MISAPKNCDSESPNLVLSFSDPRNMPPLHLPNKKLTPLPLKWHGCYCATDYMDTRIFPVAFVLGLMSGTGRQGRSESMFPEHFVPCQRNLIFG